MEGQKESRSFILQLTYLTAAHLDVSDGLFKGHIPEEKIETIIKSWFTVMGANDSILGL